MSTDVSSPFQEERYFQKYRWMEYVFITSACFGQLITQSCTLTSVTHMYQMNEDFHASEAFIPWYMASFGLTVGTLIIFSGRVGDAYGIRKALIGGYIWTCIWSLLSGISYYDRQSGPNFYVCCRAFQGAGVAFILPNVLGAVGRVYKPGLLRKRVVFGCVGFCAPWGGFIGAFMSGVIAVRTTNWAWNYYAMTIFCAVSGVLTYISVPDLKPHPDKDGNRQSLDIVGAFFAVSGLTLFNFSWNQAPVVGWDSAYIITLLVVSIPLIVAFPIWEIKFAKHPLLPPELLGNSRLMAVLGILFLGWGSFGVNIFHTFTLLQNFRHYSPFAAGAALTPAPPMGFIAAISCSVLISKKTEELILLGSMLAFTTTSILLATAKVDQSYFRNTMGAWIIAPFGMDWSFPAGSIILSEGLPPEYQGLAGSMVSVCMNYGVSIFLGVAGTVEQELINSRPDDKWRAWRGALYFNVGISGLAAIVAGYFFILKLIKIIRGVPLEHGPPADLEDGPLQHKEFSDSPAEDAVNRIPKEKADSISPISTRN